MAATTIWTRLLSSGSNVSDNAIAVGPDGSVFVVGRTEAALQGQAFNGSFDTFVSKYSSSGDLTWTKVIGTSGNDQGSTVYVGSDGSIYVGGFTTGNLNGEINNGSSAGFVTRFLSDGSQTWTKLVGSSAVVFSTTSPSGYIDLIGSSNDQTFIARLSSAGTVSRTITLDASGGIGSAFSSDASGNFFVAGYINSGSTSFDGVVSKYLPDGTKAWTRLIGSAQRDFITSICAGTDGSVYVAGYAEASVDGEVFSGSTNNFSDFVAKYSSDGTKQWTRLINSYQFGGNRVSVSINNDGSLIVSGYTSIALAGQSNAGQWDYYLAKYLSDGTKLWTSVLGSVNYDVPTSIILGSENTIYLSGYTSRNGSTATPAILNGETFTGNSAGFLTRLQINASPTGAVAINGALVQGGTLSASNTLADTDGLGTLSYQWKANGSAISGATNSTYTLTSAEVGKTITVTLGYVDGGGTSESVSSSQSVAVSGTPVCFARGTFIQTTSGPVPVEDLQIDDPLSLYVAPTSLDSDKVKWIGRQTFHPVMADLIDYLPVKISANALGPGQPFQDLYVSPDHAILFHATLIHAKVLVNGTSIVQLTDWPGDVEYFHIETEKHELVYANGLPAETFIDNVSRRQFDNYAEFEAMYPNAVMMTELDIPRVLFRRHLSTETLQRLNALEAIWFARNGSVGVSTESV